MPNTTARGLRVVYFGTSSPFSVAPLEALLGAEVEVRAVVMPALTADLTLTGERTPAIQRRELVGLGAGVGQGRRAALPMLTPFAARTIASLAAERDIPVYEVARLTAPETLETLGALQPDAICVACFPRRLPPALLALPRLGCLNVHPSLLPDNRGPDPLFWTFRRGDTETGISIHVMESDFDTGPVLAQLAVPVAEGITEAALEYELATIGGALLGEALGALAQGTAQPAPQDEARATNYPLPSADDYVIAPDRPARWANSFSCGVLGRGQPLRVLAPGASFVLVEPLGYDEGEEADTAVSAMGDAPWRLEGEVLSLRCAPGVFRARAAREEMPD